MSIVVVVSLMQNIAFQIVLFTRIWSCRCNDVFVKLLKVNMWN